MEQRSRGVDSCNQTGEVRMADLGTRASLVSDRPWFLLVLNGVELRYV